MFATEVASALTLGLVFLALVTWAFRSGGAFGRGGFALRWDRASVFWVILAICVAVGALSLLP